MDAGRTTGIDGAAIESQVRSAVFWRSGSQILAQTVMWASTLIVIRLLNPADYGLFAMTQVVMALFNVMNGYSFASALIQADSLDRLRVRQVFGMLILLNVGLAIVQIVSAPIVAGYYRQPMIADLLRVQALLYLMTPFIALPYALLSRSLDFRRQAKVNFAAAIAGALTALGCALAGLGVWTLIAAPIALFGTRAIGLTIAARLLVWPSFRFAGAGATIGFGGALLLSQLFWIVQTQADVLIAGRVLDAHALGLYAEALFLAQIFTSKFVPPLNEVAFPAYARVQHDRDVLARGFARAAGLVMLVACPLFLGLAAIADAVVETLFGPKWLAMAPIVRIIALAMPFTTLQILFAPATNGLGRPGIALRTAMIGAAIMPLAFLVGIRWGAIGLAWAWIAGMPVLLLATAAMSLPLIGLGWRGLGRAVAPAIGAAIAMAAIVVTVDLALPPLVATARLALLAGIGALAYAAFLFIFARPTLDGVVSLLRKRTPAQAL